MSMGKAKGKNSKKELKKRQLLCVLCGLLLAVLSMFTGSEKILKTDGTGTYLDRPGYGEADTRVELEASGEDGDREMLDIPVKGRVYTREELTSVFTEMMPAVLSTVLGDNVSQSEIRTDLVFPDGLDEWPGVNLTWTNATGGLIRSDGRVENAKIEEAVETEVKLTVSAGGEEIVTNIPLVILPAPERELERPWKDRLYAYLEQIDTESRTSGYLVLPSEFEGKKLNFREPSDYRFLLFPALGLMAAVLLGLRPKEEAKKRQKERRTELLVDYSEIVSKLIVYIGAGLTVRNAWKQLADSYRESKGPKRAVYEEILVTERELENGETESKAYMSFARRCELKCYIRMASLLEQNRKTGDSALLASLELEMEEAFEQRKNVARRLGEEAGTKLMAPLILSLMTVLVIVVIPAVMTMG